MYDMLYIQYTVMYDKKKVCKNWILYIIINLCKDLINIAVNRFTYQLGDWNKF